MLRLLYCALRHDYGDPSRGPSFEHVNFFDTLGRMPLQLVYFAIDCEILAHGWAGANRRLRAVVDAWRPHALLSVMFEEQIDFDTMRSISRETGTTTIGWFCDDHWRFDSYSRYWAHALQWAVTTDADSVPRYEALGAAVPIRSQWACNPRAYHPASAAPDIDVSFVGQAHGRRRARVNALRARGIPVLARGYDWPEGRVTQEEMVDIFSRSRVNLNFAASAGRWRGAGPRSRPQIKGRVFEVTGSGGLLLTDWAPRIEDYYVPGEEIVVARRERDIFGLICRLLGDEERRAAIAAAGYRRTISEHTYEKRLVDIFSRVGLAGEYASGSSGRVLSVEEVL